MTFCYSIQSLLIQGYHEYTPDVQVGRENMSMIETRKI